VTPTKFLIGIAFSVPAIAVAGVWFATEWAMWHLGFQPQLGAPLFEPPAGGEAHLVWNRRTEKEV
jgi:type IV secretion system protein VirD4